ncbi:MAG: dienelactone hydrolase family protein [Bacteroidia bacterium]|nr:dienelactone hydrolase family protein [Bacteroidia bacterium]
MKSFLLSFLMCCFSILPAWAQSSCCSAGHSTGLAMAAFADESAFRESHPGPLPADYQPKIGRMVQVKTEGGREAAVFEVKSGKSEGKIILMFHEWWGLTDHIKKEAEQLHLETGATVLAPDLYERRIAGNAEEAAALMKGIDEARVRSIIRACIAYGGKFSRIQCIGWCMGGSWSLQAAIMAGERGYGCVVYYGLPESDPGKLKALKGPVLGIYASKDQWITPELVKSFDTNMKSLGLPFSYRTFDAAHAFANPGNPLYNREATTQAHALALDFLKKNFEVPLRKAPPEAE